jgi:predicted transcriptional regulator
MARKPTPRRIKMEDGSRIAFFWIESAVVDHLHELSPQAIGVYLIICKYARNTTQEAWPSIQTIANLLGCSTNSVRKGVRSLEECKLIAVRQAGRPGREHNVYTVLNASKRKIIRKTTSPARNKGLTPSRIEGAPSNCEAAPSRIEHELEEVELDVPNQTENRKHGVADATVISNSLSSKRKGTGTPSRAVEISTVGKSKANPDSSSRLPIPPHCWERILQHVREELSEIKWRSVKRDRAALRSLWAMTPNMDEDDSVQAICDALDRASLHDETAEGIFSIATGILERDYGGTRSRDLEQVSA